MTPFVMFPPLRMAFSSATLNREGSTPAIESTNSATSLRQLSRVSPAKALPASVSVSTYRGCTALLPFSVLKALSTASRRMPASTDPGHLPLFHASLKKRSTRLSGPPSSESNSGAKPTPDSSG